MTEQQINIIICGIAFLVGMFGSYFIMELIEKRKRK